MTRASYYRDELRQYWLYTLLGADGAALYIGVTSRPEQRIKEHRKDHRLNDAMTEASSVRWRSLGKRTFWQVARVEGREIEKLRPTENRMSMPGVPLVGSKHAYEVDRRARCKR